MAAAEVLREKGIRADFVAGHSLGEYSALVAAGSLSIQEAVRLVRKRGQYMQEAVPVGQGAMAALLGMEAAVVEEVCREAAQGEVVSPANFNSPGTIVIAGHTGAVARAVALARGPWSQTRHHAERQRALSLRPDETGPGAAGEGPRSGGNLRPADSSGE